MNEEVAAPVSASASAPAPALRLRGIDKSFPGVRALSSIDLTVSFGSVHAILGENGAGKSTLIKVIAGVHQPDRGTISIAGDDVRIGSPRVAERLGIAMVYQELELVPQLTVMENIYLGRMPTRRGLIDRPRMFREASDVLRQLRARAKPDDLVESLSISQRQLVEIAKAYVRNARIVLFDEPTSSLTDQEAERLFEIIKEMRARGIAVIYISHRLREVFRLADEVTVLRDGVLVATRPVAEVSMAEGIRLMVGREVTSVFPKRKVAIGRPALTVTALTRPGAFYDVSLTVHAGEVVGLAGLVGAGRTEVAMAIFGLDRAVSGEIRVGDQVVRPKSPLHAVRAGIAYVPEDRKSLGMIARLSVRANLSLTILGRLATAGWVSSRAEKITAERAVKTLRIAPPSIRYLVEQLSGGNQQKVVLGRCLAIQPSILILDEPTRGVDVGAKAEIHRIIGDMAASGTAVLIISSELPEILAASDRIYVLHEGRIAAEIGAGDASEELVMKAASGE